MYEHPQGNPYFKHDIGSHHYLTEDNMYDTDIRDRARSIITQIEETMNQKMEGIPEVDRPQNVDVFLETSWNSCDYYMVDLDKRSLFWLEKYDATWMADDLGGIETKSQLCEHTYLYLIRRCSGLLK